MVPGLALEPGARRSDLEQRAHEILGLLTIDHLTNEYSRALSGGQRKLLELGRLLMLDPAVIYIGRAICRCSSSAAKKPSTAISIAFMKTAKAIILISHNMGAVF